MSEMVDEAKAVERVAAASMDAWVRRMVETGQRPEVAGKTSADLSDSEREFAGIHATACIAAYKGALSEAGYVTVPREPTEAMLAAGEHELEDWHSDFDRAETIANCAWAAMIEAASK
jgi:hypothetical protein